MSTFVNGRTPLVPPDILPVPDLIQRPLWSVMIPTYNCLHYLKHTLESVLAQGINPEFMQIEVVDDCSSDGDIKALVEQIGEGRIGFFQQSQNQGSLRNFETCLQRSVGKWIHILHGDDMVVPGFYKEIEKMFLMFPHAGAAFTDFIYIGPDGEEQRREDKLLEEPGIPDNWLGLIATRNRIQPPSIVVKRSVYEDLGSFYGVHYGEDWEMWVRISSRYSIVHSPEYLALYRVHTTNITSDSFLTCQNIKDVKDVINRIQDYLPLKDRGKLRKRAKVHFSRVFAVCANKVYHDSKNRKAALMQVIGALGMSVNRYTMFGFMKILGKILIRYKY